MKSSIFLTLAALAFAVVTAQAADGLALIPKPQKVETQPGVFALTKKTKITYSDGAAEVNLFAARLRHSTGFKLSTAKSKTASNNGNIAFLLDKNLSQSLGEEGYELTVTSEGVVVSAPTTGGLFYGSQTLLELLPANAFSATPAADVKWEIPCVKITDSPRFQWRGLLVDVSRHFIPADDLKKFIDVMALHKLNRLHLHLTDDQGWRLEIKKYPRLTEVGSIRKESPKHGDRDHGDGTPYGPFFYTQAQIRDLVKYAQERHVTIMPEIEMPGHLLGVLTAYPQYSCKGGPFNVRTRWGVEEDVLCIGNTNSIEFMQDILTEVLDLFPSPIIHIGGDEVPRDRWHSCPKCQALMKAEGLKNEAQLQTWFNHHIETFLASKGRRMIGWDEILEGGLTPGAAVMSWRGVKGGIEAAQAGHDVVMSPNSHLYLDHAQSKDAGEPESIGGFSSLENVYSYEPVPSELSADKRKHILGPQGNLWAEYIWNLQDFEYKAYPRACALSEVAWSAPESKNFADFNARLTTHVQRLELLKVNYRKLTPAK